jgi:hypothetical protein
MTISFPRPIDRRIKLFIIGLSMISMVGFGSVAILSLRDQSAIHYLDLPLHLVGGAIAGVGYVLLISWTIPHHILSGIPKLHLMLSTLSFVALVAVFWEFFELFTDAYLQTGLQGSVAETLKDIAVGLLGGLMAITCWPRSASWKQNNS